MDGAERGYYRMGSMTKPTLQELDRRIARAWRIAVLLVILELALYALVLQNRLPQG